MPRSRPRKSPIEDLAAPFADLPPLAGVITAALLVLLGWAAPLFAGGSATAGIWLLFARWFVWLLAAVVLAYTLVGLVRRLVDCRAFDGNDDPVRLTWSQFERLIAEFYRRKGATVTSRGGPMSDGGVDLVVVTALGERLIVQCKHWKTMRVGVRPLRELWGVLGDEKADGAIFVTSGSFSPDAVAFAQGKRLELIGGHRLRAMIGEVKVSSPPVAAPTPHLSTSGPPCPRCGSSMVLRTARHGANAGQQFWGCSTYPKCQGTLPSTA